MNAIEKIALTKIKGLGPKSCRNLLAYCGSVEEIFRSSYKSLSTIPGLNKTAIQHLISKESMNIAEYEYEFSRNNKIDILWYEDIEFPNRLRHCEDAPMLLFKKGESNLNHQKVVSVVGTRNASHYGRKITEELIEGLQSVNALIVSGLAFGIDITAHREALKQHLQTVAVLGHGLDRIYPYEHYETAIAISNQGCLITEFCSGTLPDKMNFPMRNRIIAGLADVTVVVEAAHKGGALITADIANSYNRDVCAFPGNIDQPYSAGCNYLIKSNAASLIRNSEDLIQFMQWEETKSKTSEFKRSGIQLPLLPSLNKEEELIFRYLQDGTEAGIDDIAAYCNWSQSKLAAILLEMEMNGAIISLPGKQYKLP